MGLKCTDAPSRPRRCPLRFCICSRVHAHAHTHAHTRACAQVPSWMPRQPSRSSSCGGRKRWAGLLTPHLGLVSPILGPARGQLSPSDQKHGVAPRPWTLSLQNQVMTPPPSPAGMGTTLDPEQGTGWAMRPPLQAPDLSPAPGVTQVSRTRGRGEGGHAVLGLSLPVCAHTGPRPAPARTHTCTGAHDPRPVMSPRVQSPRSKRIDLRSLLELPVTAGPPQTVQPMPEHPWAGPDHPGRESEGHRCRREGPQGGPPASWSAGSFLMSPHWLSSSKGGHAASWSERRDKDATPEYPKVRVTRDKTGLKVGLMAPKFPGTQSRAVSRDSHGFLSHLTHSASLFLKITRPP